MPYQQPQGFSKMVCTLVMRCELYSMVCLHVCCNVWTPVPIRHNNGYFCQHPNTQGERDTHTSLPFRNNNCPLFQALTCPHRNMSTHTHTSVCMLCSVLHPTHATDLSCDLTCCFDIALPLHGHINTFTHIQYLVHPSIYITERLWRMCHTCLYVGVWDAPPLPVSGVS